MSARGYDADFLGLPVALPRLLGDRELHDLPYPRFSVILDTRRRLAAVTGVNIDGATLHDLERTGRWQLDPRVPVAAQAGPELYARNDLDRGHLVRRRDPGWGEIDQARAAAEATFFYPNAAPQASVFNQSKDLWLGLEDHVLSFADAAKDRVSVFTAPVLADDDPEYRGVRIPLWFWKTAAWVEVTPDGAPVLAAAGFVLDQTALVSREGTRFAVSRLGAFRTFQAPIPDIGERAGIDFGPLVAADVFTSEGARRAAPWRELRATADVQLR